MDAHIEAQVVRAVSVVIGVSLFVLEGPLLNLDQLSLQVRELQMTVKFAEIIYRLFGEKRLDCGEAIANLDLGNQVVEVKHDWLLKLVGESLLEVAARLHEHHEQLLDAGTLELKLFCHVIAVK
jgi:hypothetical protein